jgi:hypothetical protein
MVDGRKSHSLMGADARTKPQDLGIFAADLDSM